MNTLSARITNPVVTPVTTSAGATPTAVPVTAPAPDQPLVQQSRKAMTRQYAQRHRICKVSRFAATQPSADTQRQGGIIIGKPPQPIHPTPPQEWQARRPDVTQRSELMDHLQESRTKHYEAFTRENLKVGEQLSSATSYSRLCKTAKLQGTQSLAKLINQAITQAKKARLPHSPHSRTSYNQWRKEWNAALDKDIKLLEQLSESLQQMGLAGRDLDRHQIRLADLMDVLRSDQYELEELGDLLKSGHSMSTLAAGLKVGLNAKHLPMVTDHETLEGMSPQQRGKRFERLVQYKQALPAEQGTGFFRLAKQALQERMAPASLAVLDGLGATALRWVEQGGWLSDAQDRVAAYRKELPDMDRATFIDIAAKALDCGLSAEHLKPMVIAGVPIHLRMKPSDQLEQQLKQAQKKEWRAMGGGASGSELQLLTLTHADGTEEKLVTKKLVMTPIVVPYGHANAGIPFKLEDIGQLWDTEVQMNENRSTTPTEKAELQQALESRLATALVRGDTEIRFNKKGPQPIDEQSSPFVVQLKPGSLPNLYGRDLAMRTLASVMGQPGLVAKLQTAVIDGVYCEVAAFNPDMHKEVIRPNSDAVLELNSTSARQALAAMSEEDLQQLATSRGFESAQRLDNNAGVRFVLSDKDKAVGYYNRFDINDPSIRQRYNEHQVKNFLGNEADDHESNSTVGASWDHDGSFGIHTSTTHHKMPRLVSASTWAALQRPDWTRFDGLILPKEIDALKARHQALLDSKPLVVQDGEWGSAEVTKAMDVDQLNTLLEAFDTEVKNATTPAEHNRAFNKLSNAILDLETPLAKHAGAWAAMQRESQISGRPSTPFFDQVGWISGIEASGQPVKV